MLYVVVINMCLTFMLIIRVAILEYFVDRLKAKVRRLGK